MLPHPVQFRPSKPGLPACRLSRAKGCAPAKAHCLLFFLFLLPAGLHAAPKLVQLPWSSAHVIRTAAFSCTHAKANLQANLLFNLSHRPAMQTRNRTPRMPVWTTITCPGQLASRTALSQLTSWSPAEAARHGFRFFSHAKLL